MSLRVVCLLVLAISAAGAAAQSLSLAAPIPTDYRTMNWIDIGKQFLPTPVSAMLWWKEFPDRLKVTLVYPEDKFIAFGAAAGNDTDYVFAYGSGSIQTIESAFSKNNGINFSTNGTDCDSSLSLICRDQDISGCGNFTQSNVVVLPSSSGSTVTSTISGQIFRIAEFELYSVSRTSCDQSRNLSISEKYRFLVGEQFTEVNVTIGNTTSTAQNTGFENFRVVSKFETDFLFKSPTVADVVQVYKPKDSDTDRQGAVAGIVCGLLFGLLFLVTGIAVALQIFL